MRIGVLGNRMYESASGRSQREQVVIPSSDRRDSAYVDGWWRRR